MLFPVFSHDRYGGWSEEDHAHFMMIYDQYPYDLANRRMLIIDRLKRQVPGKSRADLVSSGTILFILSGGGFMPGTVQLRHFSIR